MPTQAIDVLDTAVKIGLGAVITGVSTYLVAISSHNREIQKAKIKRRQEMLEDIAEKVELFTNSALRYYAAMMDHARSSDKTPELTVEFDERQESEKKDLRANYRELSSAEAKLLLLGHNRCQELVRDYGESLADFYGKRWTSVSEEEARGYRELILKKREQIFKELQKNYNA